MTLNPIHLQASVPRTSEMGQLQQHALHKPVADQNDLAQQALKDTELSRTQAQKLDETEKKLKYDEKNTKQEGQYQQSNKKKREQQANEEEKTIHPYKGHSIDIKL